MGALQLIDLKIIHKEKKRKRHLLLVHSATKISRQNHNTAGVICIDDRLIITRRHPSKKRIGTLIILLLDPSGSFLAVGILESIHLVLAIDFAHTHAIGIVRHPVEKSPALDTMGPHSGAGEVVEHHGESNNTKTAVLLSLVCAEGRGERQRKNLDFKRDSF